MRSLAPDDTKKPAFGYVRVSTARQAAEGVSLEAQEELIRARCVYGKLDLLEIFVDSGISGKKSRNRPALQKAIAAACESGGTLIFWSLSRFGRNAIESMQINEKFKKAGASLISLKEDFNSTTTMGKLVFTIIAAVAEAESESISDRTTMALDYLRSKGQRLGGTLPFGWDVAGDGKTLVPNAVETAARDRIIQLREGGKSLRAIAELLNAEQIKSKTGKPWGASSIQSILGSLARARK